MARIEDRLPQNVEGEFFVDSTCIDCGICRWVAPAVFAQSETELSYVRSQPDSEEARTRALMALVACPTSSIGTASRLDAGAAAAAFPERMAGEVYFCGFASESSYGASSWLIRRPDGNVLVDSPRAAGPLMKRLADHGGVRFMFLTHKDDVADHRKFHDRFACERILHRSDLTADTMDVERVLEGREPVLVAEDLTAIPVPGHTRGSAVLLHKDEFLFTGDHLWGSIEDGELDASRSVCWYSWPEQIRSMERLLDFRFEWVLPGHGDPYRAPSAGAMRAKLERLIARMRARSR